MPTVSKSKRSKLNAKAAPAKARKRSTPPPAKLSNKLESLIGALRSSSGATVSDMMEITGWQAHSVRGALSGALKKKRGLTITSAKRNGERFYRIEGR